MALVKSAINVSCILAAICSAVMSQAPPANTDPALFANLFMSSPQTGSSSNMINPPPAGGASDMSSLIGGNSGFSPTGGASLPPSPMFPTLGGNPMASAPPALPRPNPMSGLLRMMLFRKMDMGNMWPLFAMGGLGGSGGGGGGMFSNPLVMFSVMNNM